MPQMPPSAPAPAQQAPPAEESAGGGQVTELVSRINEDLIQLLGGLSKLDPGAAEQVKGILGQFREFVQGDLGGGGAQKSAPGNVPPEAGAAKVQPAY